MSSDTGPLMQNGFAANAGAAAYRHRPYTPPWEHGAKKTFAHQQQQQQSARSYEDIILATLKSREFASRDEFRTCIAREHRKVVENLLGKAISYLQRTRKITLAHGRDSHEYRLVAEQQRRHSNTNTAKEEQKNKHAALSNNNNSNCSSNNSNNVEIVHTVPQKRAPTPFTQTKERASVFETLLNQIENGSTASGAARTTPIEAERKRCLLSKVSPAMAHAAHSLTALISAEPTLEQEMRRKENEKRQREADEKEKERKKKEEEEAQQKEKEKERKKKEEEEAQQKEKEKERKKKEEQEESERKKKEKEEQEKRKQKEQEKRDIDASGKDKQTESLTTTTALEMRVTKLEQKVLFLEEQLQQALEEKICKEEARPHQKDHIESEKKKKRAKKRPADDEEEDAREVNETMEIHWMAKPTHKRLKGALPEAFANMFRGGRKGDASINNIAWYFRRQTQNNQGMDTEEWHALPKEVSQSIQNAYERYSLEDRTHPVYKNDDQKVCIQFVGLLGEYNGESGRFRRVQ